MSSMRDHFVRVYGSVRDADSGPYHKGLIGTIMCADETDALLVSSRVLLMPRVDRAEICRYDRTGGMFYPVQIDYAKDYRAKRGIPEPNLFFGSGQTSIQATLDGIAGSGGY